MTDVYKGRCDHCNNSSGIMTCPLAYTAAHDGDCLDWRMYKLSADDKAAEKAKQADAHMRDKERRKMNRKQRRKDARGGA